MLGPTEYGLVAKAAAIDYEPQAVVVHLTLSNRGAASLAIERAAIMLSLDELEYAVEPIDPRVAPTPTWLTLAPSTDAELRLRYNLGRPLLSAESKLILRSLTRDGVAVIELPELALPAMPLHVE